MPAGNWVSSLPFGPCTATVLPSILTVTPLGSGIGFFPIRDIKSALRFSLLVLSYLLNFVLAKSERLIAKSVSYQTSHNSSPPRPCLRAWRPVITPRGVVRMLIPRPPRTRGISVRRTYTRHPGRDTRSTFEIAASLLAPYFR